MTSGDLGRSLPPPEATAAEVAALVDEAMARLDEAPRNPRWRTKATGMNRSEALALVETHREFNVQVTLEDARTIARCARRRGLKQMTYIKRAVATVLVACEGIDPDEIPHLVFDGLIGPWRDE